MKLEMARVRGFRSITEIELDNCGGFNVLIGKNNSGKSNILTAIHAFFACIQEGNVVTLAPSIGDEIDFYNRQTDDPIEIMLGLSLTLAERDALVGAISTEASQMRNAVEGIDPSLWLYATVRITRRPRQYGYVSRLTLGPAGGSAALHRKGDEKTILEIGPDAAAELYQKSSMVRQLSREVDALQEFTRNFDADDWRRLTTENRRDPAIRVPFRAYFSRFAPWTPEAAQKLESTFANSASFEEFASALANWEKEMREIVAKSQSDVLSNRIRTFAGEQDSIPDYASSLIKAIAQIKVLYLKERREAIGKKEAARLLSLKVQRGGTDILRSIQDTVAALLGVKIDAFESGPAQRRGETQAEMDVDDFLVEVNGAGVREALRLVLDVEFEQPQILLVEEPEIHLHPALETSTMRFLKRISSTCQVFITTHSTNFLDTAEMNNVYLVSKNGSTRVQHLDLEGAETQIPEELGIRLSSLFMYDRLVFVEGASDEAILREWAAAVGVNFGQANVGFIAMGGVRNFAHYATEATLAFLSKRRVKMWFLIDRDEKDDAAVKRMQERLGNHAVLKTLSRREIENYMIVPRALAEFIAVRQRESSVQGHEPPSAEDIKQAIDECAEEQKYLAAYKRIAAAACRPVFPDSKGNLSLSTEAEIEGEVKRQLDDMVSQLEAVKQNVDRVVVEQTRAVGSEWTSAKLSIVLGDLLLDSVCRKYGIRFKKERDGARLASFMTTDEIADELKRIVHEIGG